MAVTLIAVNAMIEDINPTMKIKKFILTFHYLL